MTWLWVGLHAAGAVAGHVWGLWLWYWGAFALVEAAGLVWGFPYTWTVRAYLRGGRGPWGFLRDSVVLTWAAWFCATWALYSPLPDTVVGVVMVGFGVWVVGHLIGDRR